MSEKSFYIVPMKNNYIEKLIANSKEEALTKFVNIEEKATQKMH